MSYIDGLIEDYRAKDEDFRASYDEEVARIARERARRQRVMSRIAAARRARKLTQEQLGESLKISQERVSQIERGVETVSFDRFLDMAAALGLRVAIVTDEDVRRHNLSRLIVTEHLNVPIEVLTSKGGIGSRAPKSLGESDRPKPNRKARIVTE